MSRAIEFLEEHQSPTPSRWQEEAQWRRDNGFWLEYSRYITMQVLRAMDEQSVTQAELARRMGCTQQYVSNLLKGSSNMTLETIARLENALNIDIVKSALNCVRGYNGTADRSPHYLSDSRGGAPDPDIKTSELVSGYKPLRKKK